MCSGTTLEIVPLPPNERSLNVQGVVPYNAAYLQLQWALLVVTTWHGRVVYNTNIKERIIHGDGYYLRLSM